MSAVPKSFPYLITTMTSCATSNASFSFVYPVSWVSSPIPHLHPCLWISLHLIFRSFVG